MAKIRVTVIWNQAATYKGKSCYVMNQWGIPTLVIKCVKVKYKILLKQIDKSKAKDIKAK